MVGRLSWPVRSLLELHTVDETACAFLLPMLESILEKRKQLPIALGRQSRNDHYP
jgi:hypothetical protein